LVLAGCGTSNSADHTSSIEPPTRPTVEDCGAGIMSSRARNRGEVSSGVDEVPLAGSYRYSTKGRQTVPGAGLRAKDLPSYSRLIVTPVRKTGNVICFGIQRRFASDIAYTSTYVSRGSEVYLVRLLIQALGESHEVRPNPPVLFASSSGSSWSGQFAGSTQGAYKFSALGKSTHLVGSRRVPTLGISSEVSYQGEVTGKQLAITWISIDDDLIVKERLRSRQDFGVSTLNLQSSSHLVSLRPVTQGGS
jgi:hypothetical protein